MRPVSQSARSLSGSSSSASSAASSDSDSASMCRRTKPPSRMSFSYVPRWVARYSRRRRLASREAGSGSLIGAVSYSRATTPCQPVDHDPLTPLFSPLTTLKGVGPTVGALIAKAAGGERVIDLLFHLPESYLDRRQRPTIAQARPGQIATLAVEVVRHEPPGQLSASPGAWWSRDGTGFAELVFFKFNRERQMPVGREAAGLRQGRAVQRPAHHAASRARGAGRPAGAAAGDRAGLAADRRSVAAPGGERHGAGTGAGCRRCPSGTTRRCCGARNGRHSPRRCARCRRPPQLPGRRLPLAPRLRRVAGGSGGAGGGARAAARPARPRR